MQLVELVFDGDFGLGGSLAAPKRRVERCDLDATGELNLRRSFRPDKYYFTVHCDDHPHRTPTAHPDQDKLLAACPRAGCGDGSKKN